MTDLQRAFEYASEAPAANDNAARAWHEWFDALREYQAAARNLHPLRTGQLFDEAA